MSWTAQQVAITGGTINNVQITGLPAPINPSDAATKSYVDSAISSIVISVKAYGAVGDGTADDTVAIQAAVTAALPKSIVFFPAGVYKITSSINITSGITLRGVGFEGILKGTTLGSCIKVMANIVGFNITCDDSVTLEKLEFFGGTGGNTATMVEIDTDNSAAIHANYGSIIRDCMFTAAARGILASNILNFVFDNCNFYNLTLVSCQLDCNNSPGNGDATIVNSTFSGGPTNGHFRTGTLGGLRIANNKFNMPSTANMVAMVFGGATVSALGISPLIITGNSIEGVNFGILFQRAGSGTMTANNIIISGNEIVCSVNSGNAILSQVSGGNASAWVLGGAITGNFFFALGTSITIISIDAAQDINIAANQFMTNAGAATAVTVGATTARIGQNANAKGLNVA